MKRLNVVVFALLGVSFANSELQLLDASHIQKLVAAISKQPPASMDITYYRTVWDLSRDAQDFRRIYEEAATELYGPEEDIVPAMAKRRERMIQLNTERCLKEREVGKKSKIRIRYQGGCHRIDHVRGVPARTIFRGTDDERFEPGKKLDATTDFTVSEIRITDPNNVTRLYTYFHNGKTVSVRTISERQARPLDEVTRFAMMPSVPADIVRKKLFDQIPDGLAKANVVTMEQLQQGTLAGLDIAIDEDTTNAAATVQLRIVWGTATVPALRMLLVCDPEDYAKVYSYEARTARGVLLWKETRSDFDSQGFPHNVTRVQYDDAGNVMRRESYQVEAVQMNVPIPPEAFAVDPKGEYTEMGGQQSPAEQRAHQLAQYKEWLKGENRVQRVRALVGLKELVKDDPGELRRIATSMQNDPAPDVRKAATWVLQSLKSEK